MLLSRSNESERWDWDAIREPAHAADVWSAVARNFDRYFTSWPLLTRDDTPSAQLATRFRRSPSAPASVQHIDGARLQTWLDAYEKSAKKYRDCFDPESVIDYEEAPSEFKTVLARRCEIIQRGLNSRNPDLKDWILKFKAASSQELLDVFRSMLVARAQYEETFDGDAILGLDYDACDDADALRLEPFNEDPSLKMPGIIGMGIRSAVLHFLNARLFLQQNRGALYGLYFLTDHAHFDLPSRTSPFLMIDDVHPRLGDGRNARMEYNYWYPYGLGTLFALRLYRAIDARCRALGVELDPTWRYVYVRHFLDHVCAQHPDEIKVMRGGDDLTWG